MRAWVAIAVLGLVWPGDGRADDPVVAPRAVAPLDVTDQAAPVFTVYTSQDGLSDEIWSTAGFDAQGFVWAGSASELARFDGYRWTPWPFPAARSLVRDMQTDDDGVLWAAFEREGLARFDGRAWSLQNDVQGFIQRFGEIRRSDGGREFWAGHDGGLSRLEDGRWQPDPGNATIRSGRAVRVEQTERLHGSPRQWMATAQDGLWYRELRSPTFGPWQRFDAPELDRMLFTDLLRTEDRGEEELWVLSYGGGLARIRADGIRLWRAATGELPSEAMYSARVTYSQAGERLLWIASRAGLLRVRGDTITAFDRRHGLPSDAVRGIKLQRSIDGIDLLWLATEGGLARAALTESQWRTVSLLGATENGTFGVMLEPDGRGSERLWVGTAKHGVGVLQQGEWRYFSRADGSLPSDGVRGIWRLTGPDGTTWRLLSLTGGTLLRVDDALQFSRVDTPWPTHVDEAAAFALSRRHAGMQELWFATLRSGVFRWRAGAWTPYLAAGATAPWSVLGLTEQIDAAGRAWLWAASNQGLARFDGEQWQLLREIPNLPVDGYRSVTLIAQGARTVLWASSNRHGVVRVDVTDPSAPIVLTAGDVPPPPDPTVYSVLRDSRGRIYVCTNNGVQQLTPQPDGSYRERVFRRRDGMVHDECNTNAQTIDTRDRYWVGTLGGLSLYDPNLQTRSGRTRPKPLHFTDVRVDGERREVDDGSPLELRAGARELQVDFALLSGLREAESTYRSQLVGFDPEPGAWTNEHRRSFTALPPGDYELTVQARDYAGTAAEPRALTFTVQPFWWQRAWVQATMFALALIGIAGLVLVYNRSLRARQRQLKREVAARTSELRDANLRLTELSYLDPLTGVANRRRLMEAVDTAIIRAAEQSLPIGLIVIDVDHFKHYNDQHGHLAGDAALRAVAQALESATREQDLVARFGGEEFACLMIDADIETVARIAERMRALVEALPPRTLGNDTQTITISVGVFSRVPHAGERTADLLRETDAALYRAKHEGRNCVRRVE